VRGPFVEFIIQLCGKRGVEAPSLPASRKTAGSGTIRKPTKSFRIDRQAAAAEALPLPPYMHKGCTRDAQGTIALPVPGSQADGKPVVPGWKASAVGLGGGGAEGVLVEQDEERAKPEVGPITNGKAPTPFGHLARCPIEIRTRQQQLQRTLLDWLRVEYGIAKPSNKLLAVTTLDSDARVGAGPVERMAGRKGPSSTMEEMGMKSSRVLPRVALAAPPPPGSGAASRLPGATF
jgi:hypothetical protein